MNWWMEFAPGFLVVVLLVVCLAVLRRTGMATFRLPGLGKTRSTEQKIQVLERQVLSAQHTLYLVQVGKVRMLVSGAPASCQLVAVLPEGADQVPRVRHPEELS